MTRKSKPENLRICVIGGGVAGSTVALRLAEVGFNITLIESGSWLVNGPPFCHLHAGGSLYREISDSQCVTLLRESIDTIRIFPHTFNRRPTVIAVPVTDPGNPQDLLPRLRMLQNTYKNLIEKDPRNEVLGAVENYYQVFTRSDIEKLSALPYPDKPNNLDDWLIPVAKSLSINTLKFPIIAVQEFGWSLLRMAATVSLALEQLPNCNIMLKTKVISVKQRSADQGWNIRYKKDDSEINVIPVDFLVNACGYQTGTIDDMLGLQVQRMVEFKATYFTEWYEYDNGEKIHWPEVVFHGIRGTPNGMAQLTPYPDNIFQIHGMTKDITLFTDGLVSSTDKSAQPELKNEFMTKLNIGWDRKEIEQRTKSAIIHVAKFLPSFASATLASRPMFGAQQIPGKDPLLRAANVSFHCGDRYARVEIVKASSAITAADAILKKCIETKFIDNLYCGDVRTIEDEFPTTVKFTINEIQTRAENLAFERRISESLALSIF